MQLITDHSLWNDRLLRMFSSSRTDERLSATYRIEKDGMANLSPAACTFRREAARPLSPEAFEKLLRSRLSRFLTERAPWKEDLRLIVEAFKQRKWMRSYLGGF